MLVRRKPAPPAPPAKRYGKFKPGDRVLVLGDTPALVGAWLPSGPAYIPANTDRGTYMIVRTCDATFLKGKP